MSGQPAPLAILATVPRVIPARSAMRLYVRSRSAAIARSLLATAAARYASGGASGLNGPSGQSAPSLRNSAGLATRFRPDGTPATISSGSCCAGSRQGQWPRPNYTLVARFITECAQKGVFENFYIEHKIPTIQLFQVKYNDCAARDRVLGLPHSVSSQSHTRQSAPQPLRNRGSAPIYPNEEAK